MKYITVFFILISSLCTGQKEPVIAVDTLFYPNGSLKVISYKSDFEYKTTPIKRYYKESLNPLDWNQPMADTSFINYNDRVDSMGNWVVISHWTEYGEFIRKFLGDSSSFTNVKYPNFYSKPGSIEGLYNFGFPDLHNLRIYISYNQYTSINGFAVGFDRFAVGFDRFAVWFDNYANVYSGNFKSLVFSRENNNNESVYNCGKYGLLSLEFDTKNLLHKIYLYDTTSHVEQYYELDGFYCLKKGYYSNRRQIGEWSEYHQNGNLSAIGSYKEREIRSQYFTSEKDGIWNYYNSDGSFLKKEIYKEGKLINKTT